MVCVCFTNVCMRVCSGLQASVSDESLQGYYCYYCSKKLSKVRVIILALVMFLRSLTEKLLVVLESYLFLGENTMFDGMVSVDTNKYRWVSRILVKIGISMQ